jgi:deoxyribodipyrimidine photo-lyase
MNPFRQASRFDPRGDYVRRYVPELAGVEGSGVHRPWTLDEDRRRSLGYPPPIIDPNDR